MSRVLRALRLVGSCLPCAGLLVGCAVASHPLPPGSPAGVQPGDWVEIFNHRDLSDWEVKFAHHELGENFNRTFRVEDGLLKVRYDRWSGFGGEFGHLFYRKPYSYYLVSVEYRFVGTQVAGAGPSLAWARRNNGVMVHSQSAESMGKDQDFPISLEVQLLGGLGEGRRPTANLCTPGTNVVMGDTLVTQHCLESRSRTFDGDQWVRVMALVLGDSVVKHIVEGDTVIQYRRPQMGGGAVSNARPGVLREGELLRQGYIALQAETAPIDFRSVEVLNLQGCTDPKARNYRSYFLASDPAACRYGRR